MPSASELVDFILVEFMSVDFMSVDFMLVEFMLVVIKLKPHWRQHWIKIVLHRWAA